MMAGSEVSVPTSAKGCQHLVNFKLTCQFQREKLQDITGLSNKPTVAGGLWNNAA